MLHESNPTELMYREVGEPVLVRKLTHSLFRHCLRFSIVVESSAIVFVTVVKTQPNRNGADTRRTGKRRLWSWSSISFLISIASMEDISLEGRCERVKSQKIADRSPEPILKVSELKVNGRERGLTYDF